MNSPFGGANIVTPPEASSKPRFQRRASLKDEMYLNLSSDPADKLFQHMHRMSMKAKKKVKAGQVDKVTLEEISETSSDMTLSNTSEKVKPLSRGCLIIGNEEERRVIPRYLLEEDNNGVAEKRKLGKYTRSLLDRSRDINNPGRITAIFKYKERIIYVMKPVNYSMTPTSALKVQWRIARSLLTPSFLLVFSMLNRYGTVIALIKCTPNSAMCVFATVEQAQRAMSMHSLNQSSKLLILSWWHRRYESALINEGSTTTKGTSRWLENVCEGLLQSDEISKEFMEVTRCERYRPCPLHTWWLAETCGCPGPAPSPASPPRGPVNTIITIQGPAYLRICPPTSAASGV